MEYNTINNLQVQGRPSAKSQGQGARGDPSLQNLRGPEGEDEHDCARPGVHH